MSKFPVAVYRYFRHYYHELGALGFVIALPRLVYGIAAGEWLNRSLGEENAKLLNESIKFCRGRY